MKVNRQILRLISLIGCLGILQLIDGLLYANGYLWHHRPIPKDPKKPWTPPPEIPVPKPNPGPPEEWAPDPILDDNGWPKYGGILLDSTKKGTDLYSLPHVTEKLDEEWKEDTIGNWQVWYDPNNYEDGFPESGWTLYMKLRFIDKDIQRLVKLFSHKLLKKENRILQKKQLV